MIKTEGNVEPVETNDPLWDRYKTSKTKTDEKLDSLRSTLNEFETVIRKMLNGHYIDTNSDGK